MSQPELARLLSDIEGVSCSLATVKRWESGKTEPRIKDAEAIARVLGVSINYLTGWGGRKE
jgi:transcriptional regulator with XRE-family HTH domain